METVCKAIVHSTEKKLKDERSYHPAGHLVFQHERGD